MAHHVMCRSGAHVLIFVSTRFLFPWIDDNHSILHVLFQDGKVASCHLLFHQESALVVQLNKRNSLDAEFFMKGIDGTVQRTIQLVTCKIPST